MLNFTPLADRVLVRPLDGDPLPAGLVLPDNAKDRKTRGEVVSVGEGIRLTDGGHASMEVRVGDVVLYGIFNGSDLRLDGESYVLLETSDIHAVLQPE